MINKTAKETGMPRKLVRIITLLCCVTGLGLVTTGCALTKTKVQIQLSPTASNPLGQKPSAGLVVGDVRDTRAVAAPFVLVQKRNGYGQQTSGAYVAQKPIAEIFRDGLVTSLTQNGFAQPKDEASLELKATIQEFDFDAIVGFISASVTPKLTVRFELCDKKTGIPVWHDTYIGRDTLETSFGSSESKFLVTTFQKASDDVFRQLTSDSSFRSFLSTKNR